MAIPSGSGTEVLKRAYIANLAETEQYILTGVQNHIYTILSITIKDQTGASDAMIDMWIDFDAGGTDLMILVNQLIPFQQTFIWNDKLVLTGTDKLGFIGKSASDTADFDIWC